MERESLVASRDPLKQQAIGTLSVPIPPRTLTHVYTVLCSQALIPLNVTWVLQAAQQENASKGQGLGPMPVPAGAPAEVARVLRSHDYYEVLELPRSCTAEEVRAPYCGLVCVPGEVLVCGGGGV